MFHINIYIVLILLLGKVAGFSFFIEGETYKNTAIY